MLTERDLDLHRKALATLRDCGGYLLPDDTLRNIMRRAVTPPATTAEVDEAVAYMDRERRIHATRTETGLKYAITDLGRSWYAQHA